MEKSIAKRRIHVLPTTLLLTESYFRDRAVRVSEYIFWFLASTVGYAGADEISVGLAQAKVTHWRNNSLNPPRYQEWRLILLFLNPVENYDICFKLLEQKGQIRSLTLHETVTIYTGCFQHYYYHVALWFQKRLINMRNSEDLVLTG